MRIWTAVLVGAGVASGATVLLRTFVGHFTGELAKADVYVFASKLRAIVAIERPVLFIFRTGELGHASEVAAFIVDYRAGRSRRGPWRWNCP